MELSIERDTKVATAAASLYVSNLVTLILNTAFIVLITNFLPLAQVGLFSLLNIVVIIVSTFSVFALPVTGGSIIGTPPAVTRFLPDLRLYPSSAKRLIIFSFLVSLVISSLSASIIYFTGLSSLIAPANQRQALSLALLDCIAYSLAQIGAYTLIGIGKATDSSKVIIVSNAIRYLSSLFLVVTGFGIQGIFAGFVAGDFILALSSIFISLRGSGGSRYTKIRTSRIAYYSLSVFGLSLTGLAVTQLDKILAYLGKGLESLGVYNIAVIGASIVSFAPSALINALVSYMPVYEKHEIPNLVKEYTRYVSILTSPLGFCLASVSPYLLIIFGSQYTQGAPVLALIAIALSATSISSVFASGLLVNDASHLFTLSNVFGVVTLVFSSYIMLPFLGIFGVALGRVLMLCVSFITTYYFARKMYLGIADWNTFVKTILASAAMGLVIFSMAYLSFTYFLFPRIIVVLLSIFYVFLGFVIYLVELKFMRILGEEDIEFLRRILPERFEWIASLVKKFT